MVSYASMKLKVNNQTKTLDWNGQKIEVKDYLPFEDKYDLVMIALQKSLEDGYYNPIKLDMYFHLYLVYMYTNISFTEKQREDEAKIYDVLKSNGFIDAFLNILNEDEYADLYNFLVETEEKLEKYKQSIISMFQGFLNDLPKQAEAMKDIMDNFDPEKYQNVMNFAKAANRRKRCPIMEDLTNQKFNFLTPLRLVKGLRGYRVWECLCDCGNLTLVEASHLKNGNKKSCGCLNTLKRKELGRSNKIDIINQRFGKLTVLKDSSQRKNKKILWLCQCDCGNNCLVTTSDLKTGHTSSCGACNYKSKGEYEIGQLLKKFNISFETQKTFENCRFPDTGCLAKFDFYVNNQYLIEYDGIQHYQYRNNGGWNNEENFQKIQIRDEFKTQWCKENNIILIRIPYWKLKSLTINDLILDGNRELQ